MAAKSIVPQLVDKKRGSYYVIALRLEPGKFNKWKKRMLCYLTGMEPYYIKCIKEGSYQPKNVEGEIKPEYQWTNDERKMVNQDQHLKSIIISCLPDDIIETVISCETAKATWTNLVHSFEGPSDTKENRIMDLKLKYQTFRAKPSESLSQTYNHYKTMLNKLSNDGVNLNKLEINISIVVSNVSSLPKGFQPKFTPKLIQSSQPAQSSQNEPKIQKDYKVKYKKIKAKLALLEASSSTSQSLKTFQSKNKGLVLMALADDELSVGKNHARNGEWIDITMRKRHIRDLIWYMDNGCSRSMTGVKSYLYKYVEKLGPKVVFGDNSSCIIEGYGLINCGGIVFSKFDDKQGIIFNANKEIVLISPRRIDVYVLDMTTLTLNGACFFAKASKSVNWLWNKRLSHLNFKNINKLAKQNKFLAFLYLFIQGINHVQHVKKKSITELLSKLNKISLSESACIFFIWIYLDQSV
ncbi:retrovirus-related pol polyprotein from transposon TNT 1-94 [Tanacetum coccineum]